MRLAIFAVLVISAGCGSDTAMNEQAQRIIDSWPKAPRELVLTMKVVHHDWKEFIHCTLTNVTDHPITLDASLFPWVATGLMDVRAVTRRGTELPPYPIVEQITAGPDPQTLAPGSSVEGEFEPINLNITLTRDEDVLLVWRHGLTDFEGRNYLVFGTTFLEED
jgi:hypothetical protein